MTIFGITLNRYSLPILYLACAIIGFLLVRESVYMFQHPIASRAITILLGIGFVFLSLPAVYKNPVSLPLKASILIVGWLSWTLLSTLLGDQPWPAMMRWFELLISISMAFCLYIIISQQPQLINLILKAIIAAIALSLLAFIVYWNLVDDPIKHNWVSDIPLYINIRHFGYLAAISVPIGHWFLHQQSEQHLPGSNNSSHSNKNTYIILSYLILSWTLIFWLGGRGAFLAALTTSILYGFIERSHIKWILFTAIAGLGLSLFFIVDNPSLNLFRHFGQQEVSLNTYSSSRIVIYTDSLIHWWQHSPIFGIGADGFRYIIPAIGNQEGIAHPHSSIIQLILSYGLVGLLIPCYFFFVLSWKVVKSNQKTMTTVYLILLSTLILSIVDGVLYHAYGLFISSIIAGICTALVYPQQSSLQTVAIKKTRILPTVLLVLGAITTFIYTSVFIFQLYHSKHGKPDTQWINWNAKYPIYFSSSWTYDRYNSENFEEIKQRYLERASDAPN